MKIKVRGDAVYPVRDDVRSRRISKVRPYRDEARLSEPGYVHSLPSPADGKSYFHRDDEGAQRVMRTFFGRGEDDPEAEEIEPPLPEGDYYGMNSHDGVHIYRKQRDEGEALPMPANNGMRIGNDLPARLAEQNKVNDAFWKRQYAGGAPNAAPPNARAIASTIAAARSDTGTHDAAMLMQKANRAVNLANRAHYAGDEQGRAHDAPRPRSGPPTAAEINARNRARWGAGRQ